VHSRADFCGRIFGYMNFSYILPYFNPIYTWDNFKKTFLSQEIYSTFRRKYCLTELACMNNIQQGAYGYEMLLKFAFFIVAW